MVSNGESWYARDKVIGKSSVSNVEKASCGKRVLDVECKNGFRFGFKEDKVIHANDFASTSTASLVKPESAQVYKKTKKQTDIWESVIPTRPSTKLRIQSNKVTKKRQIHVEESADSELMWHKDGFLPLIIMTTCI
ncbi:hypothetical protein Tco_0332488 [Tanacetum coccineum]